MTNLSFILTIVILSINPIILNQDKNQLNAGEVVSRIKERVNYPWMEKTRDTFKSGSEEMKVTGIVTTFIASIEVMEKAVEMGSNMIITHEPTFFDGEDVIDQLAGDPVLMAKQKFIEKNNLIIWRFHDHWHRMNPDGIYVGMTKKFNWEKYRADSDKREWIFEFEEKSLLDLTKELKNTFPDSDIRIIGHPEMKLKRAAIILGAPGSISQMKLLQRDDIDVIVAGETREWETVEYVRDAAYAGFNKACILLGHAVSEEAGMEYCAEWLREFVSEVPVHFVEAGDPFWTP